MPTSAATKLPQSPPAKAEPHDVRGATTAPPAGAPPSREAAGSWPFERDSYASTAFGDVIDRSLHAAVSRMTAGLSPAALAEAYFDWLTHLVSAPGKQAQLLDKAVLALTSPGVQPLFDDEEARRIAGNSNDKLKDACERHPDRFYGMIAIAPQDAEWSVTELKRGKEELGLWTTTPDYPAPYTYLDFCPGHLQALRINWKAGADPELTEPCKQGAQIAVDDKDQLDSVYATVQHRLNEAGPFFPLFQPAQVAVAASWVKGIEFSATTFVDLAQLKHD